MGTAVEFAVDQITGSSRLKDGANEQLLGGAALNGIFDTNPAVLAIDHGDPPRFGLWEKRCNDCH